LSFNVINPFQQFIDTTGKVRVSGIVTFFNNRTTVKASIFSDESLSVAQTNPYTLNANGQIAGDVKYSGLLTVQESNSDGSDVITTNDVPTIGDQTTIVEILGTVAGTNTITATGTPTITSLVDLTIYSFTAANAITGAVTLQIDSTAVKSVLKYHDQPLILGDIEANQAVSVIYNSTDDVFELISSTLNPQIQSITATVASSALTLELNPTSMYFRKTPLTDGTPNVRSNAALSLVVPSGATLGTTNALESRLILLAIDNAGTVELAVVNQVGVVNLDETTLITTTAIGTGSDSAAVFYSTTARTSVPYRVIGYVESTQGTAGTWATSPTVIQGAGGNSLSAFLDLISTNGIKFPAAQVASDDVNTFDDYEEGTWTPTLGGSTTYNTQSGTYTKIGDTVYISCFLDINAIGTGSTTVIGGLPFTSASTHNWSLYVAKTVAAATSTVSENAFNTAGTASITVLSKTAAATGSVANAFFANSTQILISGHYKV